MLAHLHGGRLNTAALGRAVSLDQKADLGLKRLFVVYPGTRRFELDDRITAVPLTGLLAEAEGL